jgi:hypothetical protein
MSPAVLAKGLTVARRELTLSLVYVGPVKSSCACPSPWARVRPGWDAPDRVARLRSFGETWGNTANGPARERL